MATRIGFFIKNNLFSFRKNFSKQFTLNVTRFLYSESALGIEGYVHSREFIKNQFANVSEKFRQKMWENVSDDNDKIIFTEDLKNFIHLLEKTNEDLDLLKKMIIKYHCTNKIKAGSFIFGTIVMRSLYFFKEPDLALELLQNPELKGFFEQISTYQILMDLLYKQKRYDEVHTVYEDLTERNLNGVIHHKNPFIIALAACYKQNTLESYEKAQNLFKEYQCKGYPIPRRAIEFTAALALNQNDPSTALEVITLCRSRTYIDVRCIKLHCYVALKDYEKIIMMFQNAITNLNSFKITFFKDCIEKVEELIKTDNLAEDHEIVHLLEKIKQLDLVQNLCLDDNITSDIRMIKYSTADRKNTQPKKKKAFAY